MRWTLFIEAGLCGFGYDGGFLPEARLGIVRVSWMRGSFLASVRELARRRARPEKTLDEICAERRAKAAEGARRRPRGAGGWFVEKGVKR